MVTGEVSLQHPDVLVPHSVHRLPGGVPSPWLLPNPGKFFSNVSDNNFQRHQALAYNNDPQDRVIYASNLGPRGTSNPVGQHFFCTVYLVRRFISLCKKTNHFGFSVNFAYLIWVNFSWDYHESRNLSPYLATRLPNLYSYPSTYLSTHLPT